MKDYRYLNSRDKFLTYAYCALSEHFPSRSAFDGYFRAIKTDELKNSFLKTASFYLFLVKRGDWHVDVAGSDRVVDYLTNTYKYVAIFSLIESLSQHDFIDFYQFLVRRKSQVSFPIQTRKMLDKHYTSYKEEFGSVRQCVSFFKALSPQRQRDLIARLKVNGTEPSIENLAKTLYEMRSMFMHEAELVLFMSHETMIGRLGSKTIVCKLSIQDTMRFFEEGLVTHFRSVET